MEFFRVGFLSSVIIYSGVPNATYESKFSRVSFICNKVVRTHRSGSFAVVFFRVGFLSRAFIKPNMPYGELMTKIRRVSSKGNKMVGHTWLDPIFELVFMMSC